jgi:hypothetical protein
MATRSCEAGNCQSAISSLECVISCTAKSMSAVIEVSASTSSSFRLLQMPSAKDRIRATSAVGIFNWNILSRGKILRYLALYAQNHVHKFTFGALFLNVQSVCKTSSGLSLAILRRQWHTLARTCSSLSFILSTRARRTPEITKLVLKF